MLEYSLVELVLLDFLLDHVVGLFASFLDPLNGFGLLFLQKRDSIMKFYHILLLFQSHSPRFLPCAEITWSQTLCLTYKSVVLSVLKVGGDLVVLKGEIFREIRRWSLVIIAIFNWVYLDIHINSLVIPIFILFNVIRAAHHVLTLVLLVLSGALIPLVHKLFLDSVWILVGGCI